MTDEFKALDDQLYGTKFKTIKTGTYKNMNYQICTSGICPTCYVEIPLHHKFYGKNYSDLPIVCHGGLTYSGNVNGVYLIGWDYGHLGDRLSPFVDFAALNDLNKDSKTWTVAEIEADARYVIDQLKNA